MGRGYVAAATIGGFIYTAGGLIDFTDGDEAFRYDPVANTWTAIANIPRATSQTRGLVINNEMWVLGGGISNPSNEVDIYNPCSNTWRLGPPFATGRRFFPADTNGSRIWLAGGFDPSGSPLNTMEIFTPSAPWPKAPSHERPMAERAPSMSLCHLLAPLGLNRAAAAEPASTPIRFSLPLPTRSRSAGATVTSSDGMAAATQSASGAVVTVDLISVADAQTITITLMNVNDGASAGNVVIPMGILRGDTNGDRFVNAGDALQTRNRSGQADRCH